MPDKRCSVPVTQEFVIASVELADAIIMLDSCKTAADLSTMPREFWTRWTAAARVIRDFGKRKPAEGGPITPGINPLGVEQE